MKRADRLVGNGHLAGERRALYGWLTRLLVGGTRHPHIIVDWSGVDAAQTLFLLRAAVVVGGRALPVYEEVHARYHHPEDSRRFLTRLAALLPPDCRPVIVTDAGFKCPWYQAVEALGWYYLGRVRHRNYICREGPEQWVSNKTFHAQATTQPRALGAIRLTQRTQFKTRAYLYRRPAQGRTQLTVHGQRRRNVASLKHATGEREPWLLVSNLEPCRRLAHRVIEIYRARMAIEQSFRDLKAHRHGFAFRQNLGRDPSRVANLLLIAALAMLATWLTGILGQQHHLERGLQANTESRVAVLSVFFIGTVYPKAAVQLCIMHLVRNS